MGVLAAHVLEHLPKGEELVQVGQLAEQGDLPAVVELLHGGQLVFPPVIGLLILGLGLIGGSLGVGGLLLGGGQHRPLFLHLVVDGG